MKPIILNFVGDISLNGIYDELLSEEGAMFPFLKAEKELRSADLTIGNLESPLVLGDVSPAFKMKTPLRANPGYAGGLKWTGFDVLNFSNNHILDYGEKGIVFTQNALKKQGIKFFGYGRNIFDAKKMKVVSINGFDVGFVGYTDLVIDSPFYADVNKPGIAKFDIDSAIKDTRHNKKLVDFLVVSLHWGIEYFHFPTPQQITWAKELIDFGADIIIGHHPHIIQGIEKYRHGIIAYSLGNFIFADIKWDWMTEKGEKRTTNYKFSCKQRESIILQVNIDHNGVLGYSVCGTFISKFGQIQCPYYKVVNRVKYLSEVIKRQDYAEFFQSELKHFENRKKMQHLICRLKRMYKFRPKHIIELKEYIYKWLQLK